MKKITVAIILTAVLSASLTAQVRNDVIKVYNEGVQASKTDIQVAIEAFENVITLSDKVGETADDLKQKAAKVLPGLYFKVAYNAFNEKKPAPEIIQAGKKAVAAAEKYENPTNKENAGKILVQAYNTLATDFFSEKDYENALLAFDSLLLINPVYLNAIYNKALIYIRQNDPVAFEVTIDSFLEMLDTENNEARAHQASTMALEYFRAAGSQANQANNLDEALVLLNKAAKYGDDKDLFYYYADVYNKQENFDKGLEYAQKGLDLETGEGEAKAKFYFQLAIAQMGKGETASACGSFKNAMYGAFAEASEVQRTNLKCE